MVELDKTEEYKRICANCDSLVQITVPIGTSTRELSLCPVCGCNTLTKVVGWLT